MDNPSKPAVLTAVPADAVAIRQIAIAANIDSWSESDYLAEIERRDSFVLKAVVDGEIGGFLLARTVPGSSEGSDIDLYNIAVRPENSRRGLGTALMAELLNRIDSANIENIWLEVRESNTEAIKFYEKHRFSAELTRPRFYSNPVENAVIMRLKLVPKEKVNSV